jgi:dihydroxyacetone kinase-like protein
MKEISTQNLQSALLYVCELIIESEPMLTELDSTIGDGDHGFGMRDGFTELQQVLKTQSFASIYELTIASGITLVKTMGGASGVIFGTLFIGGHDALVSPEGQHLLSMDVDTIRRYFRLSAQSIARRGRTKPNDRTMLDALLYAVDAMDKADTSDVVELFRCGWEGACLGAEATKQMRPQIGRAKNFRDKALGYPDPGAVSTSIIFKGLYEGLSAFQTNQ